MQKKFERQSEEWEIFRALYQIAQDYFEPEEDARYWDGLVNAYEKLVREHPGKLAACMGLALITYLETKYREENPPF